MYALTFRSSYSITGFNVGRLGEALICSIDDLTYCAPIDFILLLCEQTVGIMVACVPTLGPIFFPAKHSRYISYVSRKIPRSGDGLQTDRSRSLVGGGGNTNTVPKDDDAELLVLNNANTATPLGRSEIRVERRSEVSSTPSGHGVWERRVGYEEM